MVCPSCNIQITNDLAECPNCHYNLQNSRSSRFFHTVLPCIILAEALVISLLCFAFLPRWKSETFGSRSIAADYFSSIVNGDYDHAYEMLDIDDDLLINKETFSLYCRNLGILGSLNYQVDVTDFSAFVSYSSDNENFNTIEIPLQNTGSRFFNFYEVWKINSSKLIAQSCSFTVPKSTTLTIDSVTIPQDYISAEDDIIGDINSSVTYTIPRLFLGNHKISVSRPGYQSFDTVVAVNNYTSFTCQHLYLSEVSSNQLATQACNDLQTLFQHILSNDSFDTVSDLFFGTTLSLEQLAVSYADLCDLYDTEDSPTQIEFTDVCAQVNPETCEVVLSGTCNITYYAQGYLDLCPKVHSDQRNFKTSFHFFNVDGKWRLMNLPAFPLYY